MLKIFIGYDSKEPLAFHVLSHSILRRAARPVEIVPLTLQAATAAGYTRPRGPTESTEFSMTRFMVPAMCDFEGVALFMDCDMLCLTDINDLVHPFVCVDHEQAVSCCQHDYEPKETTKFLGNQQTKYPRKNWSSLMLFNCNQCQALTPDYVNKATGLELHRMLWTDKPIGSLPLIYNWLVGEYEHNDDAAILHYTLGGPWFKDYANCNHADIWFDELQHMYGGCRRCPFEL